MTDFQFRLWAYLITYVDDFGRGSAEPDIIKGFVFPLRKSVTEANIRDALHEMACMGLIRLYEVGGESYLCFPNWEEHQTRRANKSKFPAPDEGCEQMKAGENTCKQMQTDAPVFDIRNSVSDIRDSSSVSDARAQMQTVEVYATNNLQHMSQGNIQELIGFMEDLPDDLVRFAIDEACGNGAPRWSYVSTILSGYLKAGIKSVGDAKAAKEKRKTAAGAPQNPVTQTYQTRGYTDADYGDDFYVDVAKANKEVSG